MPAAAYLQISYYVRSINPQLFKPSLVGYSITFGWKAFQTDKHNFCSIQTNTYFPCPKANLLSD